jgi:cytochrome P450
MPLFKKFGLQSIGLSSFGFDFKALSEEKGDSSTMVECFHGILQMHNEVRRSLLGSWKVPLIRGRLNALHAPIFKKIEEIVSERLKRGKEANNELDLVQVLLNALEAGEITMMDVKKELLLFVLGGFDTSATTAAIFCHHMAELPHIQQKIREEIDRELEGKDPATYTIDDLARLVYLDACIAESMRVQPIAPATGRVLQKPLNVNGVTLPPGTHVWASIYPAQHLEEVWGSDVEQFNPEHFDPKLATGNKSYGVVSMGGKQQPGLEETKEKSKDWSEAEPDTAPSQASGRPVGQRERDYLLRFGGGPKSCIGARFAMLELKHMFASMIPRYDFKLPKPNQRLTIVDKFITSPVESKLLIQRRR